MDESIRQLFGLLPPATPPRSREEVMRVVRTERLCPSKAKPCPCCGGAGEICFMPETTLGFSKVTGMAVRCVRCGASTAHSYTEGNVLMFWNEGGGQLPLRPETVASMMEETRRLNSR